MDARNLKLIGFLTWLVIAIPSVNWELKHNVLFTPVGIAWLVCYALFPLFFFLATRDQVATPRRMMYTAAQSVVVLTCIALQPSGYPAVLIVVVAGQLGLLPLRVALAWIVAQTAIFGLVASDSEKFWYVLAYLMFQLFALVSLRIAHQESHARQALAAANAELQVTSGLLDISSRTEERLRIARDLHDVIGHHLTALSLNLEVASHLADGSSREPIEKAQMLTRTLLADVRDVVSRLRDKEPVDLTAALHALRDNVERPVLNVDVMQGVTVTDPQVAQVALRAIQEMVTNAVRHSAARNLWLKVSAEDQALAIAARDDGTGTDHVAFGNGLRGMRERVEQLHGTMNVQSMRGHGFEVNVRIPLHGAEA